MHALPILLDRPLWHPDHFQLDHTMREHRMNVVAAAVVIVVVVAVIVVSVIVIIVVVVIVSVGGISNQLKTISSFLEKRRLPEIKG